MHDDREDPSAGSAPNVLTERAPIAAKAHRPSILHAVLPVSMRRTATICTVMSNLFVRREEGCGLPLRHNFSTEETFTTVVRSQKAWNLEAAGQSRGQLGGNERPVHNLGNPGGHQSIGPNLFG
jgi:hypothetical protein